MKEVKEVEDAVVDEMAEEREGEVMVVVVVAVGAVAETMRVVANGTPLKVCALCVVSQGISAIIAQEQKKCVSTLKHVTHETIIVAAIRKESIQHWLQQITS
jgi:uncharacterized membrane protein